MKDFDERLFDADNGGNGGDESVAVGETVDDDAQEEQKKAIPPELAGISEDTAREIMAEAEEESGKDGDAEEQQEDAADDAHAESDNKQYQSDGVSNQRVPYGRFKETLDKQHELEKQLEAQKQQYAALQQQFQQMQRVPQPQQPAQPPEQPAQPQLNKDTVSKINEIVKQQAMQMTGMSADDIADLEFMDDDDPRKQSWDTAYEMAKLNTYAGIQQMQMQRQQQAAQFLARHKALINDYNAFAEKEMQASDFEVVKNYAINEYFEALPDSEKPTVAQAYARIERQVASPEDVMIIKRYFSDAKNSYHQKNPVPKRNNSAATIQKKAQQANSFPRSTDVSGAADVGGGVSVASLEQMLRTKDWDEIPEKYRNMLLTGQIAQ